MKDMLKTYVELRNRYDTNPGVSTQMLFRKQELVFIQQFREQADKNIELKKFIIDIEKLLPEERIEYLNKSVASIESREQKEELLNNNASMEEREISRKYNIPLSAIKRCYLSNGVELFQIHDDNNEIDEVLEIKESSAYNNTRTVKKVEMYTANDLKKLVEKIDRMNDSEKKKFNFIINNRLIYNVKAMNLKYFIYLNDKNELLEVMYNERNQSINVRPTDKRYIEKPQEEPRYIEKEEEEEQKIIPMHKSGFINAFLLFLFTGFAGGVLATVLSLVLSKM